jgi:hypothetical protein
MAHFLRLLELIFSAARFRPQRAELRVRYTLEHLFV